MAKITVVGSHRIPHFRQIHLTQEACPVNGKNDNGEWTLLENTGKAQQKQRYNGCPQESGCQMDRVLPHDASTVKNRPVNTGMAVSGLVSGLRHRAPQTYTDSTCHHGFQRNLAGYIAGPRDAGDTGQHACRTAGDQQIRGIFTNRRFQRTCQQTLISVAPVIGGDVNRNVRLPDFRDFQDLSPGFPSQKQTARLPGKTFFPQIHH